MEDPVQMVINNLRGPIKEALVLGDCQTFPQLVEQAARMQMSIKEVYHFPQLNPKPFCPLLALCFSPMHFVSFTDVCI